MRSEIVVPHGTSLYITESCYRHGVQLSPLLDHVFGVLTFEKILPVRVHFNDAELLLSKVDFFSPTQITSIGCPSKESTRVVLVSC